MEHDWRGDKFPDIDVCARCGAIDDDEFPEQTPRECLPTEKEER